ncbi:MAG: hypothetical protein MZV64_04825 [Ignavibacteriales bacterium]|nr:hypothetical protein [Ignavibacteriales bacterium]
MIAGRDSRYRGTQGTSICKIFEGEIGQTGASEKVLTQLGDTDFEKIYLYPNSHAGYYPGAKMMAIKVIFRKSDGRLLGAQVLGEDGVAKRIDAFAMAIQMGATIYDLEEAELCYAPPFGSAKDPVNFAGMVAGEPPARRHADRATGTASDRRVPPRRAQSSGTRRGVGAGRGQHPAAAAARAPRRTARATGRSSSSAARPCAPTTRRASCCRTASRRGTSRAACSRGRTAPRRERQRDRGRSPMTLRRVPRGGFVLPLLWSCSSSRKGLLAQQDKVAALKQSLAANAKLQTQCRWVETTVVSMKGEEKSRVQKQCFYGP